MFYVISIYSRMPRKSQNNDIDQNKSPNQMDGGMWPFGSTLSVEQAQKAVEQAKANLTKAQENLVKAQAAEAAKPPPAPAAAPSTDWFSSFFGSKPAEAPAPAQGKPPAQGQPPNQLGGKKRSGKKSRRKH